MFGFTVEQFYRTGSATAAAATVNCIDAGIEHCIEDALVRRHVDVFIRAAQL